MKVSVLLAVYNGEKYMEKAIESVLSQTHTDLELLIGLNGCSDSSSEICKKYSDPRVRAFEYTESGKARTLNKILKESGGEFLALQDHDDIWLPKKIEEQIAYTTDFDVIGTGIIYIDENDIPFGGPNLRPSHDEIVSLSLAGNNQVANTAAIFRKSLAIDVGGWDESLDGVEDYDFWLKMMSKGARFINLKKQYVLHRVHKSSNFNTKKYDIEGLLKKHSKHADKI
jgi:glycosyltransferase involved in cell wall biosynthesis